METRKIERTSLYQEAGYCHIRSGLRVCRDSSDAVVSERVRPREYHVQFHPIWCLGAGEIAGGRRRKTLVAHVTSERSG